MGRGGVEKVEKGVASWIRREISEGSRDHSGLEEATRFGIGSKKKGIRKPRDGEAIDQKKEIWG